MDRRDEDRLAIRRAFLLGGMVVVTLGIAVLLGGCAVVKREARLEGYEACLETVKTFGDARAAGALFVVPQTNWQVPLDPTLDTR